MPPRLAPEGALLERFEDRRHRFGLNADAGVGDLEAVAAFVQAVDADCDRALVGKLHGIAEQVDQHLPKLPAVAPHTGRPVLVARRIDPKQQPLFGASTGEQRRYFPNRIRKGKRAGIHFCTAGFDLGQVQDVVDQI